VPTFRFGARGIVGQRRRVEGALDTSRFRGDYHDTRVARRDGDLERRRPYGTYAMRVHYGAPVEEAPLPDAVVAAPGPLLDEVRAELAEPRPTQPRVFWQGFHVSAESASTAGPPRGSTVPAADPPTGAATTADPRLQVGEITEGDLRHGA
jgi:hypothetical protein